MKYCFKLQPEEGVFQRMIQQLGLKGGGWETAIDCLHLHIVQIVHIVHIVHTVHMVQAANWKDAPGVTHTNSTPQFSFFPLSSS